MNPFSLVPDVLTASWEASGRARMFRRTLGGALMLAALLLSASFLWAAPHGQKEVFDYLAPSLLYLVAVPLSLRRATLHPQETLGWRFFALSNFLIGLAGLLRLTVHLELFGVSDLGRVPFLLLVTAGFVQAVALLSWPLAPSSPWERRRKALDGVVFALALFFLLWALGWGQLFSASLAPFTDKLFTLIFPLLSVTLLGIALYLGATDPNRYFRGPLGWIALSLLMSFLGNLIWGVLSLERQQVTEGVGLTLLGLLMPLAKSLAPCSPLPVGDPPEAEAVRNETLLAALLPYLPMLVALGLGISLLLRGAQVWDPVLAWTGVLMVILLLVRQFFAMRDLRRFSRRLEQRVLDRTQALERSQEIMIRNQRMNTLASIGAGLAHDLNNFLGAAHTYLSLAQDDCSAGRPVDPQFLQKSQDALALAGALTTRLLSFGRESSAPSRFDLNHRLLEAEPLLRLLVPHNIRLSMQTNSGPLPFHGHAAQLDQILVNLVSNARDAMPEGGDIRIRLSPSQGHRALIEVEDTGQGMAPEVQERIFEAFFTTKPAGKGTGLGLASVQALVAQAGGALHLWSALGIGTRFTLELPLAE